MLVPSIRDSLSCFAGKHCGQKSSGDQSDSDCELIVLLSVLLCF